MGYSGADLALVQGSQVSGSVTLRHVTVPAAAYVPEFSDLVFDMAPFFVVAASTPYGGELTSCGTST